LLCLNQVTVIRAYLAQVDDWVATKKLKMPHTVVFEMDQVRPPPTSLFLFFSLSSEQKE